MGSNINIRTFVGAGIKIYLASIAKLRLEIFKDYPFLCKFSLEEELAYLRKFTQNKDAVAVLVFDGPKIVGAAIGAPFDSQEVEFIKLFQEKGLNPSAYFYFGQSVLLEPYRGRGLGHHFFDIREKHARYLKRFTGICFVSILRTSISPPPPKEYSSLINLWEKNGYIKRSDLTCQQSWKDSTAEKATPKTLIFWTKEI
ncbi:MAG: hypothetical protein LVR00_01035 [Rhabdochlamydiaceae bacterium]|jgi:GNAT superfamily N-acetyltransferase